jgi:hypothetical protein
MDILARGAGNDKTYEEQNEEIKDGEIEVLKRSARDG